MNLSETYKESGMLFRLGLPESISERGRFLSRVVKVAWNVLSRVAEMALDVLFGWQKRHGMLYPGWQIFV